ncbi:tubulin-like doman-containing protein [uncultured Corynebacterium sp.]|uniref:tubulin-like doman-containing protein n=1 Tax=uncultured Corynebacterium sp. TaxID=159447 RepID=UPI0025959017|nr:tubulin-like doman-containing protein [uncultured Corynebacterium sp.]
MKKVLIIGCGGSGAKTLAFMMDQLKTMLAERLPEKYASPRDVKLPAAWQFVSIDVPTAPEKAGKNLANVAEAGGRYISCGSSGRYAAIDNAVSNSLGARGELGSIASWALANPEEETTPISAGAGQYRGIGRMLLLSKLRDVQKELAQSWQTLFNAETDRELNDLAAELSGNAQHNADTSKDVPLVFVVSSMAGGAGASMAIDVCRMLNSLEGNSVSLNSLFMVTPDIFHKISADQVPGANPNALAMFGELVAAQFGAATESDRRIFEALGIQIAKETIPVGRVFPVGVRSGEQGTQLGDGEASTVYRALGRGLAALMIDDGAMQDFVAFTLGNKGSLEMDSTNYGWGATDPKNVPWGSYGYAQLSMGRDRYAEYAAQRLARFAVGKLLEGHLDPSDPSSGDVQIKRLLDNNQPLFYSNLGKVLPAPGEHVGMWILSYFNSPVSDWASRMATSLQGQLPPGNNLRGSEWAAQVHQVIGAFNGQVRNADRSALDSAVFDWANVTELQEGLVQTIREEVARYGAPYGAAVLERIRHYVKDDLLHKLRELGSAPSPVTVPSTVDQLGKNKVTETSSLAQEIVSSAHGTLKHVAGSAIARNMALVLEDFVPHFLEPLQLEMSKQTTNLVKSAELQHDSGLGIAQLKTDVPNLWPEESPFVPDRFSQAANEVFLTEVKDFPEQFQSDMIQAVSGEHDIVDYSTALRTASQNVIDGDWKSLADVEPAPRDLLTITEPWVSKHLVRDPHNHNVLREPRPARLEFRIKSADVLSRSRAYIARRGFSFHHFITASLRDYVINPGLTDHERAMRRRNLINKFELAMKNALPLAQVNRDLVRKLYNSEVNYKFNFSKIPFEGDALAEELQAAVRRFPNFRPAEDSKPLGAALSNQGEERAIDIFGSYPNYAPIVFSSLLPPIRQQWQKTAGSRVGFWKSRRARPLPAALPMSEAERQAMIAGWYVGRLTGRVIFPATLDVDDDHSVQIFDSERKAWTEFEAPMLTPPSQLRHGLDWLPSLLESSSLAWTAVGEGNLFESVRPYVELRRLYDSANSPSKGARKLEGERVLREWLFSGERPADNINQIPGTEKGVDVEQRKDAAIAWLEKQRNFTENYVPTDVLQKGHLQTSHARPFADIRDRDLAAKVPVYADIAPDVYVMLGKLIEMLESAYQSGDPALDQAQIPQSVKPSDSSFQLPGDGEF